MSTISAGNQLPDSTHHRYAPADTSKAVSLTTTPVASPHTGSISRGNRRSLAVIALEKTSNAFANLNLLANSPGSSSRSSASVGSLSKHPHKYWQLGAIDLPTEGPSASEQSSPSEQLPTRPTVDRRNTIQLVDPFTDAAAISRVNKMHQTSSRLLRMTEDERPFTKVCDRSISPSPPPSSLLPDPHIDSLPRTSMISSPP
jgi:hypothetical protein